MNLWKLWISLAICDPAHDLAADWPELRGKMARVTNLDIPSVSAAQVPPHTDAAALAAGKAGDDAVLLLDVREDDEWERGHAPGALHIPMGDIPARLAEIDNQVELYVICRSGGRSERVVNYLNRNGFDGINVADGMVGWRSAGRVLECSDGTPGEL